MEENVREMITGRVGAVRIRIAIHIPGWRIRGLAIDLRIAIIIHTITNFSSTRIYCVIAVIAVQAI